MCDGLYSHKQKELNGTVERKEKKQRSVEKAIPNIADAIKTVVSLSKNEGFKLKCFNVIKAKDDEEFSETLKKKLWKIASWRLNVKPSEKERIQIVPDGQPSTDEAQNTATYKKNPVDEGGGGDFFDDLAQEISFFEDQVQVQSNVTTDHEEHKTTDSPDFVHDSSFESLAELHWDLSEENPQSSVQVQDSKVANHTAHPTVCVSKVQEPQQCSAVPTQELQCSAKKGRDNGSSLTATTPDFTSPKAKLRCQEVALTPDEKNVSSNDWLQEFTQDCFWLADKNIPENLESEPLPVTSKENVDACEVVSSLDISLSQHAAEFTDDFDALAEFSAI